MVWFLNLVWKIFFWENFPSEKYKQTNVVLFLLLLRKWWTEFDSTQTSFIEKTVFLFKKELIESLKNIQGLCFWSTEIGQLNHNWKIYNSSRRDALKFDLTYTGKLVKSNHATFALKELKLLRTLHQFFKISIFISQFQKIFKNK